MSSQKNLIFDIQGVLFDQNPQYPGQKLFCPIKEGIDLLQDCFAAAEKSGHKLFICSNLSMRYLEILEEEYPEIVQCFEGIVSPSTAQAKKPDPQIFTYLLDTYRLTPDQSIFIDDQIINIETARKLGISTIHAHNFEHVRKELKGYGIL